jgi:hypothetical protein
MISFMISVVPPNPAEFLMEPSPLAEVSMHYRMAGRDPYKASPDGMPCP